MWTSEITVKQHLKEMHQEAQMHRMAVELRDAAHTPAFRVWLTRMFALLRRRRQPEMMEAVELTVLAPPCPNGTPMRRAS